MTSSFKELKLRTIKLLSLMHAWKKWKNIGNNENDIERKGHSKQKKENTYTNTLGGKYNRVISHIKRGRIRSKRNNLPSFCVFKRTWKTIELDLFVRKMFLSWKLSRDNFLSICLNIDLLNSNSFVYIVITTVTWNKIIMICSNEFSFLNELLENYPIE